MSHSSALFSTGSTLQNVETKCETSSFSHDLNSSYEEKMLASENVENKYQTSSSSSGLNSSYEEEMLDSETEKSSCTEYEDDFKELRRKNPWKPDKSDNFIKRKKIHAKETELCIVPPDASISDPSISGGKSAVHCKETSDDSVPKSEKQWLMDIFAHPGSENIDEMIEKEASTVRYPPLKDSYQDIFIDLKDTSFPEYDDSESSDSEVLDDTHFAGCIKKVFEVDVGFSGNKIHTKPEDWKVTTKSECAVLRNEFVSELQMLSQSCTGHNSSSKDPTIKFKVQRFLNRIFHLGKYKVLFNKEDNGIASLILPVIKHIVFVIELSVIELESRIDLLKKKSALRFLVDNFGQLPVDKELPPDNNLSHFLKKPLDYCNSLLDNVLKNRSRVNSRDEYDVIDNSGMPPSHCWWYEKEYLHDMAPET